MPIHDELFQDFGQCARQVFSCALFMVCGGPVMLILGAVMLGQAARDPRLHTLATYNDAVKDWSAAGGNGAAFLNAFPASSSLTLEIDGPQGFTTMMVPLTVSTKMLALTDRGGDVQTNYVPVAWLSATTAGASPAWPSVWSVGSSNTLTLSVVNTSLTAQVAAWQCSNQATQSSCTTTNGRKSCVTTYSRNVAYLSSMNLLVQVPEACASGPCTPTALTTDSCSYTYAAGASQTISSDQYNADRGTCAGMTAGSQLSAPPLQPAVSIRSTADPRVAANKATGCTLDFGPTAKEFRASGAGLIIAGVLLTACMVGVFMVACRRRQQRMVMVPGQPGVVGMAYVPPGQPGYGAQPQYAQQQQAYPQPGYGGGYAGQQQAYPQAYAPQPGYAPNPAFGQPYAQPQGYAPQQGAYVPPQGYDKTRY